MLRRLSNWPFPVSLVSPMVSKWFFPASLASKAVQLILSFLPGASLVLRAATRGAHPRICREPGRSPLKLYLKLYKIRRPSKSGIRSAILRSKPPWCVPRCPNGSFLPPWCLPGASQAVQLVLSCLPGASQAVKVVLSYLPGASQVPRRLPK